MNDILETDTQARKNTAKFLNNVSDFEEIYKRRFFSD